MEFLTAFLVWMLEFDTHAMISLALVDGLLFWFMIRGEVLA